ncbi:sodium-coupled monocarboxylate transporter 1 [Elysia marginata]|uniref:Sodium-coupled monocarboxylate transporter 1 n=1 Tax=Elysia marginata TaxID=1093978 RepID=A0AAV4FCW1_9GAST|nr:sodium-coupled monocarboxylate transporter 1 [Elysia marginata]
MDKTEGKVYFGAIDYVVLGIMLTLSMAVGLYFAFYGKGQRTKEEYLLGGRRMSALPVCLSLFATFQSAISLLGLPTEAYSYGTMYIYTAIGISLSSLFAVVSVVPLLYPLRLTNVFQYLALRYKSNFLTKFGVTIEIVIHLSYMTMALVSPALALETTAGIPLWLSVVVIGGIGTFYTTIGGIKSVIWTDAIQTFFMFIGIFTVLIKGCIDAGGFTNVWSVSRETGRIILNDISIDPRVRHTVWNLSFCYAFFSYSSHFSQSSVQRIISTRSIQDAKRVHLFKVPITVLYFASLLMTGLVISAYFHITRCDPLAAGYISNTNQVMPYFVLITLSFLPGFAGLYISSIFSGALSTLSSGINSLAANTVDIFLMRFLHGKSEFVITSTVKLVVCFYGFAAVCLAYLAKDFQGPVSQINYTILAPSVGAQLGLFLLGAIFPQANSIGAVVGCCSGFAISLWQTLGASKFGHPTKPLPRAPADRCFAENTTALPTSVNRSTFLTSTEYSLINDALTTDDIKFTGTVNDNKGFFFYDLSYVWTPVIGLFVTVGIGLIISVIANSVMSTKHRPKAKYIFPFCRWFWYSGRDTVATDIDMESISGEIK